MPRPDTTDAPLFTIEHEVEIPATPRAVWAVLVDFDAYPEWNPYVLAISGALSPGATLDVTITQSNWAQPLAIQPRVVRAEPERVLHWRGQLGDGGVLDTDHSFHIEPGTDAGVRFVQREEFRGSLAPQLEDDARAFTHEAFRAMNEALAGRVASLR